MNTRCHSATFSSRSLRVNQNIHAIRNGERCKPLTERVEVRLSLGDCSLRFARLQAAFRIERLTRLVPAPVRFVLRNDIVNMKRLVIILLFVFVAIGANAQFFDNTLVKVRPLKFFLNPNVGLEKPLCSMVSLTSEVAYRQFENFFDGRPKESMWLDTDEPYICNASKIHFNGAEVAFGARLYLITFPNKYLEGYYWIAPFGMYYETIIDYSHSWANDVQIYDYGRSYYEGINYPYYRSNVNVDNLSILILLGYQYNFMNTLSVDLNFGARYYCISTERRRVISTNLAYDDVNENDIYKYNNRHWQIAGRFTIGYYIRYDWMKKRNGK